MDDLRPKLRFNMMPISEHRNLWGTGHHLKDWINCCFPKFQSKYQFYAKTPVNHHRNADGSCAAFCPKVKVTHFQKKSRYLGKGFHNKDRSLYQFESRCNGPFIQEPIQDEALEFMSSLDRCICWISISKRSTIFWLPNGPSLDHSGGFSKA